MLKIELERAVKRPTFIFALLIGIFICIFDITKSSNHFYDFYNDFLNTMIITPYDSLCIFNLSPLSNIYFIILPVLCAISYSDSYLEDLNSGFLKNILSRYSKTKYLNSKFGANFIVSGLTIVIPIIIQLLFLLATRPNIMPEKLGNVMAIVNVSVDLYLHHPLIYTFIWIFIWFLFAGVISSITLAISIIVRNKFVALITPFICLYAVDIILGIFHLTGFSVLHLLYFPSMYDKSSFCCVFIIFLLILGSTYLPFYIGGKSNENF